MSDRPAPTLLTPAWAGADALCAWMTTRAGGVSGGNYDDGAGGGGLNLGGHVGDAAADVRENRRRVAASIGRLVVCVEQVHGRDVCRVDDTFALRASDFPAGRSLASADALVTNRDDVVLAILCADCLPVIIGDLSGRAVGIAHAGWRGLAGGVIEATIAALRELLPANAGLAAWIGPGIGPDHFEVGDDVRAAFLAGAVGPAAAAAFVPGRRPGKWFADLPALAAIRLRDAGVGAVAASGICTFADGARFYSHRRHAPTGRMAALAARRTRTPASAS
ncbi:MAG: peptidoglycan editing factor PgeF [Burkholderiaceae bacterium]